MEISTVGSSERNHAWHGNENNHTEWSQNEIKTIFENFEVPVEDFDSLKLTLKHLHGNNSVSIQNDKRTLCFDMKLIFEWRAEKQNEFFFGEVEIPELTANNLDKGDYEIRLSQQDNSSDGQIIRNFLKKNLRGLLNEKFFKYIESFRYFDLKNSQKEKNFNSKNLVQKNEEEEKKNNLTRQAEGSLWNTNLYHWEERELSQTSRQNLAKKLKDAKISFLDETAQMTFFLVNVDGEASLSLRKGKKILFFDLKITADWTCVYRLNDGTFMADSKGQMQIPEFSSENINDTQVNFIFDSKHPASERINQTIRSQGREKILKVLEEFIEELRNK